MQMRSRRSVEKQYTGVRPKILFVDDDPLMHLLYQPHIERAGYDVVALREGAEAGSLARKELPQVVIMDMVLPDTDGAAAIHEIKGQEATRTIPVIAISANPEYHRFRREILRLGAEAFLSKPFSPQQL